MGCILFPIMGICQGEILGEFYRQIIQGGLVCKVRKAVRKYVNSIEAQTRSGLGFAQF